MRKIIHLDMDCFYAAVEIRDHPVLKGRPVAVGGSSRRGVLTTCNYEARKFGCRSAMPTYQALKLCPDLVVVPLRFEAYKKAAYEVRDLMHEFTPHVEPLSLDEAFLDVTEDARYAWDIAKALRARIWEKTQLTASAGIAPNKLLAKIASDWRKPNGQFAVRPEEVTNFMRSLPVGKLWGIGPKTSARLEALGIRTCADVQSYGLERLQKALGNFAWHIFQQSQGLDDRPVKADRIRKSLSNERTFDESLTSEPECQERLPRLVEELQADLAAKGQERRVTKVFVRLKFDDFEKTSRERVESTVALESFSQLLGEAWQRSAGRPVRLMGVGVRFAEDATDVRQLELF